MKVFIVPSVKKSNPYQELLVSSLRAMGVDVQLPAGFWLPWRTIFKRGRPDVIHLQWQHQYFRSKWLPSAVLRTILFFLQWLALRGLGVRFVWTVHNLVNHEKYHTHWELLACRLLTRGVDSLIVHCAGVVPVVAAAYRIPPERIQVVPHGHYADWYPPAPTRAGARQVLGLPAEARVFLSFGQIRAYKGLDQLLDAFAGLKQENARLILAGEPRPASLGSSLSTQAAADSRVITHFEFIDDEQLITYLSACDLVVLPYRDSLTSGAVVLAASYGRPALMPSLGCMAEFPSQAAIVYDPNRFDGLHLALEQALSAPLETMGAMAKHYIEQFPWPATAARTLAVYQSVLTPNAETRTFTWGVWSRKYGVGRSRKLERK